MSKRVTKPKPKTSTHKKGAIDETLTYRKSIQKGAKNISNSYQGVENITHREKFGQIRVATLLDYSRWFSDDQIQLYAV